MWYFLYFPWRYLLVINRLLSSLLLEGVSASLGGTLAAQKLLARSLPSERNTCVGRCVWSLLTLRGRLHIIPFMTVPNEAVDSTNNQRLCTCTSSSVQTFLSIFRLRTLDTLGPSPLCSPKTCGVFNIHNFFDYWGKLILASGSMVAHIQLLYSY